VPVIRIGFAVVVHCRVIQPPDELLSNLIPSENIARGGLHVANGTRNNFWDAADPTKTLRDRAIQFYDDIHAGSFINNDGLVRSTTLLCDKFDVHTL
jgi:hypothetical protein